MGDKRAGSGHWIPRDVDVHRCHKPAYDSTVSVGDRWVCDDCGQVWRVRGIDWGPQHDPFPQPSITWDEVEGHGLYRR